MPAIRELKKYLNGDISTLIIDYIMPPKTFYMTQCITELEYYREYYRPYYSAINPYSNIYSNLWINPHYITKKLKHLFPKNIKGED